MKSKKHLFGLSKLGAAVKVAIPAIALAAPLGHASSRNVSASRSGGLRSNAVVHVSDVKANGIAEQRAGRTGKRSAFSAFSNRQHKKTKSADVKVDSQALAFLEANNLLNSTGIENAGLSGDLVFTEGRKQFLSCTNLPSIYTNQGSCTGAGHIWNSPAPEVDVAGNNQNIFDGDSSPSTTDHTDFGSALTSSGTEDRTFTISNTGSASLTIGAVSVTGTHASDFTVTAQPAGSIGPAGSTTFTVQFDPTADGPGPQSFRLAIMIVTKTPITSLFRVQVLLIRALRRLLIMLVTMNYW